MFRLLLRLSRRARALALLRVPRAPLAQAADGRLVRVQGRVRPGREAIRAHLTGRRCVFFEVHANVRGLIDRGVASELTIEDGGAEATVELSEATVLLDLDAGRMYGGVYAPAHEAYLRRRNPRQGPQTLFREGAIEPGERVTVVGRPHLERAPDDGEGHRRLRVVFRGRETVVTDIL